MLADHLLCSELRCLLKWDLLRRPRRLHHPFPVFLHIADRILYDKTYTVDQTDPALRAAWQRDPSPILGDKFRFCRHDGLSIGRLRELIDRPLPLSLIGKLRYDHQLHKIFYKCTFSGSDGSYDAQIYFSAGSLVYILVHIISTVHKKTPLLNCYSICRRGFYMSAYFTFIFFVTFLPEEAVTVIFTVPFFFKAVT